MPAALPDGPVPANRAQAAALIDVSRETWQALDHYVTQLCRWQPAQNLVSSATLDAVWTRHIADCVQLYMLPDTTGNWLDIGSGAGLPGLIGAIVSKYHHDRPGQEFVLVESNQRKCAFLKTISRELDLNVRVERGRIEAADPDRLPDIGQISARAVANLTQLLLWGQPWWARGASGIFQKGRDYQGEVEKAAAAFDFDLVCYPSKIDAESVILDVRAIRPRPA